MGSKAPAREHIPPKTLDDYLALPYRLEIVRGEYGSYVVHYPDLPGCVTQVRQLDDAIPMAREILEGWLEIALEDGQDIPLPPPPVEYSGRILLRIPKSLHRHLAESAAEEGVSLNAHVSTLLAAQNAWQVANRRFDEACAERDTRRDRLERGDERAMEARSPVVADRAERASRAGPRGGGRAHRLPDGGDAVG